MNRNIKFLGDPTTMSEAESLDRLITITKRDQLANDPDAALALAKAIGEREVSPRFKIINSFEKEPVGTSIKWNQALTDTQLKPIADRLGFTVEEFKDEVRYAFEKQSASGKFTRQGVQAGSVRSLIEKEYQMDAAPLFKEAGIGKIDYGHSEWSTSEFKSLADCL